MIPYIRPVTLWYHATSGGDGENEHAFTFSFNHLATWWRLMPYPRASKDETGKPYPNQLKWKKDKWLKQYAIQVGTQLYNLYLKKL